MTSKDKPSTSEDESDPETMEDLCENCRAAIQESRACTAFISPLRTFQYIRMPFGLVNARSVYSRMWDISMKDMDREFWTSYLDDILTISGEPWARFGHLT